MGERYDAYSELGGNTPSSLSPDEEQALYNMGLGKPDMHRRVEARNKEAERAAQDAVNKAGGALGRQVMADIENARGVDKNSTDYFLQQKIAERNKTRRS